MDQKLIIGAIVLLLLQAFLLVSDFDFYPHSDNWGSEQGSQEKIGFIVDKKQKVKRRASGSIIWEDSQKADNLMTYDSILTLENSSAHLQLKNDVEINLHENTLIVLEPPQQENDGSLHIRFSRGNFLSHNRGQNIQVGSGEWSLNAKPGTDLSLKSLAGDKVEVEVLTGAVHLEKKSNGNDDPESQEVSGGTRFTLEKDEVSNLKKVSAELHLLHKPEERIYSHTFPVTFLARWEGSARQIRLVGRDQKLNYYQLQSNENHYPLSLAPGTYFLSLVGANVVSSEIVVRIIPAPLIQYTSPLPRDRVPAQESVLFSWLPLDGAATYEMEITNLQGERLLTPTQNSRLQLTPKMANEVNWRVFGVDEKGFRIPPHYSQPLFILDDFLAPPKLLLPRTAPAPRVKPIRQPAESPSAKDKTSLLRWPIHQLFFSQAFAEEPILDTPQIIFSWLPVAGADFYNIEISSDPDFSHPEIMAKVTTQSYSWPTFQNKIYYWRVAAGSNSGRMGLFSETAKADLTHIDQLETGEIYPGVQLVQPDRHTKVSDTEFAGIKNSSPTTPPAPPTPPTKRAEESQTRPKAEAPKQSSKWQRSAQIHLEHAQYNLKKSFSSTLEGFADFSIGGEIVHTTPTNHIYLYRARFTQLQWQPEDTERWPYQENLTTREWSLLGLYSLRENDFRVGAAIENLVTLKRADLEKLDSDNTILIGPTLSYYTSITHNISLDSVGGLLYGNRIFALSSVNAFRYTFSESPFSQKNIDDLRSSHAFFVGGDFNFRVFFGPESLSGFYLNTGLHLGYTW